MSTWTTTSHARASEGKKHQFGYHTRMYARGCTLRDREYLDVIIF